MLHTTLFSLSLNHPWQTSLTNCWTDATCKRALVVSHGGDWNITSAPYGSLPAFEAGYEHDADAVKGDFRVTKDNVGVIVHSSPFNAYETLNCYNKKVEEMTASEVVKCKIVPPASHFITAPDMLSWAAGDIHV